MTKIDSLLYDALINQGHFGRDLLEPMLKEADTANEPLASILIKRNVLSEPQLLNILAQALKLSYLDVTLKDIDRSVMEKVPLKIATYYKFLPLEINNRNLTIAVSYPLDIKMQDEIRTQLGCGISMVLSCSADISEALKRNYGLAADTLERITLDSKMQGLAPSEGGPEAVEDIEKVASDASVVRLVNQIILEGWKKRATDIHIEPYRQEVHLRYRIDGLLYDANVPAEIKNFLNAIISRIKIMSNLNIVERRLPQDGRAIVKVQDTVLDLRISTMPTPFGESIAMRILPANMLFSLEKLGLSKHDQQIFETVIQKPHGVIFVTGPTGSGKTTTLYTCLNRLNTPKRKIITIEDPIEYEMAGLTQIQVMPEIGLDFARGLRSILRHDPDVIMVGEVRDLETAEIAIRVALTGHLVFSTLHTNDAASGIARLVDIGVEPYLLASSVEAFIAQRLIRLICQECKYQDTLAPEELKIQIARDTALKTGEVKIWRGRGCAHCNFTGYFGRTAIYEILLLDDQIKNLILKKTSSGQIKRMAVSKGMHTLRRDGWQKVISGLTTPEEIMEVTPASEQADEAGPAASGGDDYLSGLEASGASFESSVLDKRAFIRLSSKVNVRYKILDLRDGRPNRALIPEQFSVTRDISAGGLLFISGEPIVVGSILELKIELPDSGQLIECLARAVRIIEAQPNKSYDIAVCFLDITSAQRARLSRYVQTNAG